MKKLISAIMVMAMLTANLFTVAADAPSTAELIAALPEASAITASTEELRTQIEDINEALIADGLTETDFDAGVWAKWQAVSAKNAYYLPTYDTIDISSAAKSVVFADAGETLESGSPDYRMNYTTWGAYYAFKKSAMTEIIGADELMYTETGVPFSFPKDYRKAIGEDSQSLISTSLAVTPKTYRNIAVAATAIGADTKAEIRFIYTDGSSEAQTFTVPKSYDTHGNLAVASSQNNFLHCYPKSTDESLQKLGGAAAKIGMSWFEFPVDANRELKEIQFLDLADPDGTNADGTANYTPRNENYRILAVTGCTDISQAEKDARTAEGKVYESVDISSVGNSIAYVDGTNLDKSSMTLTSLDLFDWSQVSGNASYNYGKNFFAVYKDNMTEAVGDDEKVYNRDGVPYSFPKSNYKAIAVKKDVADSVSIDIGKSVREIKFLAATGQYQGSKGSTRITYTDGTYSDSDFTVHDSWGYGQSSVDNMVFAPRVVYGTSTMATDGTPAANRIGMFEVALKADPNRTVEKIEFKSVDTTSNYKVMAVTLTTDVSQTVKKDEDYKKTTPLYVDVDSIGNGKLFIDSDKITGITGLTKYDYISYNVGNRCTVALKRENMTAISSADGLVYAEDYTSYKIPSTQYKMLSIEHGEPKTVDITKGNYENISFVLGTAYAPKDNAAKIVINYTDNTSDTKILTPQNGYYKCVVTNALPKVRCLFNWSGTTGTEYAYSGSYYYTFGSYTVAANPAKIAKSITLSCSVANSMYYVPAITLGKASTYTMAHSADGIKSGDAVAEKAKIDAAYAAATIAVEKGYDTWDSFATLLALKKEISSGYKVSADAIAADNNITVIITSADNESVSGYLYTAVYNGKKLVNVYKDAFTATTSGDVINRDIAYSEGYTVKCFMFDSALAPLGAPVTVDMN